MRRKKVQIHGAANSLVKYGAELSLKREEET